MSKNTIIAKAATSKNAKGITTLKLDGKKYAMTERVTKTLEKLDVNGRTILVALNKENEVAMLKLFGALEYREETPKYGKEDETYNAVCVAAIGYPCQIRESDEDPFMFTLAVNEAGKEKASFLPMKVWGELGEKAKLELKTPEGEKAPRLWVEARKSKYKGKDVYTVTGYGVITD